MLESLSAERLRGSRFLSFINRHWNGDNSFWASALIWSIAVPLTVYVVATLWLTQWSMQDTPTSRMFQGVLASCLIFGVAVWQLVGTWRATSKSKSPQRSFLLRWPVRAIAALMCFGGLLMLKAIPAGMSSLYLEATDQDWIGQNGYTVSVEDTNLIVSGHFAWGLLSQVSQQLSANPGIDTIVLNSLGGHVGVGTRMYDMIRARGLDTYTMEECSSSCTLAFLAGNNRYLKKSGKLGFHAVAGNGENSITAGTAKVLNIYRTAGVPEAFIEKALGTPPSSAWYPKAKDLLAANVVTEVVK